MDWITDTIYDTFMQLNYEIYMVCNRASAAFRVQFLFLQHVYTSWLCPNLILAFYAIELVQL